MRCSPTSCDALVGAVGLLIRPQLRRLRDLLPGPAARRRDPGDAGHPLRRTGRHRRDRHRDRREARLLRSVCRCSTGTGSRASSSELSYDYGAGVERCPAPCLGYSFLTKQPVGPELLDRLPVTASLAIGAAVIWLRLRGVGGRDLRPAPRVGLRSGGDDRGPRRRLACRSSSPGWCHWPSSATSCAGPRRAARTCRSPRTRSAGAMRCCCPGSRWRSCSRPSTRG